MNFNDLNEKLNLIKQLNIAIKDNKKSIFLAQELMEHFPQFKVTKKAYRAIYGEWKDNFDNIHWSHTYDGSMTAYTSVYGHRFEAYVYSAQVEGFDVFALWSELQNIALLKDVLSFRYIDEQEIMVTQILSSVEVDVPLPDLDLDLDEDKLLELEEMEFLS